jgi:hypothetical protein
MAWLLPVDSSFLRCRNMSGEENPATSAGRDNFSILPLEWISGKLKKLAGSAEHAYIECYHSFLGSR